MPPSEHDLVHIFLPLPTFDYAGARFSPPAVPNFFHPVARQIWLVMHPDVKRSPRVRLIADLLIAIVEKSEGDRGLAQQ